MMKNIFPFANNIQGSDWPDKPLKKSNAQIYQ